MDPKGSVTVGLQPYLSTSRVVEFRLGKSSARKHLGKAMRLVENMRVEIPAEDLRVSFLQDKMLAFETAIENEMARKTFKKPLSIPSGPALASCWICYRVLCLMKKFGNSQTIVRSNG